MTIPARALPQGRSLWFVWTRLAVLSVLVACKREAAGSSIGPGSVPGECASPKAAWLWCDDFDVDRLARYFEYDSGGFTRVPGVGRNGSVGMRARWTAGQTSAGSLHLAFGVTPQAFMRAVDAGTAKYRELYWRLYLKNQAGWTGGGGDKLSRVQVLASASWAQAMIAPVWSGDQVANRDYLLLDPVTGTDSLGNLLTTTYGDVPHLRFLGAARSATAIFATANVGVWRCIEAHVRLNDPGQANGVFELWIDNALEAQRTALNWLGSYSAYGLNTLFVENYWNAGAPRAEERFIDNLVVSTQRIGCL
jgi:hypothetical protein